MSRRLRPALILSVWTVLVWTTRIRNIWTDEELTTDGRIGRTALALSFTTFAVVTIVAVVRARGGDTWSGLRWWVRAFALWTGGVWIGRAIQIAVADHDGAFIAVHTALAVISIGLGVWADRALRERHPVAS